MSLFGEAEDGTLVDTQPVFTSPPATAHAGAFCRFIDGVARNRPDPDGLRRAVTLMGLVDAIYRSAGQDGREVTLL